MRITGKYCFTSGPRGGRTTGARTGRARDYLRSAHATPTRAEILQKALVAQTRRRPRLSRRFSTARSRSSMRGDGPEKVPAEFQHRSTISQPIVFGFVRFWDAAWIFAAAPLSVYFVKFARRPEYAFDPVGF